MKKQASFLLVLMCGCILLSNAQGFTPLDLAGTWQIEDSIENAGETWLLKDSTELNGFGFDVKNNLTQITETLMLKKVNSHWLYIAQVGNQNPISFSLVNESPNTLKFVNFEHDFPQIILYEFIDKNHLKVQVGTKVKTDTISFEFKRK
jgi:hypothetical protein